MEKNSRQRGEHCKDLGILLLGPSWTVETQGSSRHRASKRGPNKDRI